MRLTSICLLSSLLLLSSQRLPAADVLVLDMGTPNQLGAAVATSLGHTVTLVTDEFAFADQILLGAPWDLVILEVPGISMHDDPLTLLQDHILAGGKAIVSYHNFDSPFGDGAILRAAMQLTNIIEAGASQDLYDWSTSHPIWTTPNALTSPVMPLPVMITGLQDFLEPAVGATAIGGFGSVTPVATQGAIVLGNNDRTIAHGFRHQDYDVAQMMQLLGNEIGFLLPSTGGDPFIRGDINDDGSVNLPDVVLLLNALFVPGSAQPACMDAADMNGDGALQLPDAITVLQTLFASGPPLPAPYPNCGTAPLLGCLTYISC